MAPPPTSPGDPSLPGALPSEPPPPYTQVNTSAPSTSQNASSSSRPQDTSHLRIPAHQKIRNGIPLDARRSMEDEARPLPQGWVRQFDSTSLHQFFVDTTKTPPRAIWHHPYDDDEYMATLPSAERTRIHGLHRVPSDADVHAESTDGDTDNEHHQQLPPRTEDKPKGLSKFSRKMKDKITQSTHEEREQERQQRAEQEQAAYARYQKIRECMLKAAQTGERQFLGRDKNGKDVYIDPPSRDMYGNMGYGGGMAMGGAGSGGYGMGYPGAMGYGGSGYGWSASPYGPNSTVLRPAGPYRRPYGGGYGGGMGLPLMGGLMGGAMLGGLMF